MHITTHRVFIHMRGTRRPIFGKKIIFVKKILVEKRSIDAEFKVEQLLYNALLSKLNS